jgi:beta-fructofuranosidase
MKKEHGIYTINVRYLGATIGYRHANNVDNPTELVAGNQHWGHATSPDLYNWTNQPIALYPPEEGTGVFSGSAVIDTNNTSGFFPNQTNGVVAVYTLNTPEAQTQNIAFSYDNGYTFEPYENNPVIDIGSNQFRDPKVIWYKDHWVMVIAYSTEFVIGIYTSPDLIEWTHTSNISHVGLLGVQYECPNLVPVPVKDVEGEDELYVLTISLNPGAPLGGSVTEWFPGHFNGTHFEPLDSATRLSNFAKDNYAGQFFYGTPSEKYPEPVSIAWASNWQYTNIVPTASEGWRSSMTLAKDTYLTKVERLGWALVQKPHDLSPILDREIASSDNFVNITISANIGYDNVSSNAIYFQINLTIPENTTYSSDAAIKFNFSSSVDPSEKLTGGYYLSDAGAPYTLFVDRGKLQGFESPLFTDKFSISQAASAYQINGMFDRSLLEVWLDDGAFEGTVNVYPKNVLDKFELSVGGGIPAAVRIECKVWALKSTWQGKQ